MVQNPPDADDGFLADDGNAADDDDVAGFSYAFVFPGDAESYSTTTVCGIEECDEAKSETSLKILRSSRERGRSGYLQQSVREGGLLDHGHKRRLHWTVSSDGSGTSGRVGGSGDDSRNRTWSYSVTLPGSDAVSG